MRRDAHFRKHLLLFGDVMPALDQKIVTASEEHFDASIDSAESTAAAKKHNSNISMLEKTLFQCTENKRIVYREPSLSTFVERSVSVKLKTQL